jgi:hypothetical protein
MKLKSPAAALLILLSLFVSCNKSVQLTIPTIISSPLTPGVFDTVRESLIASAAAGDQTFKLDSCLWQVLDGSGQQVSIIRTASDTVIKWVPLAEGDYRIIATVFSNNNSVTANAQIHVSNTPAAVQRRMVGQWKGTATSPWIPPYPVTVQFFSNGQYSARCTNGASVAFYYGSDADDPSKTFQITSIDATGANGNIVIFFFAGDTNLDSLTGINLTSDNKNLKFEFWHGRYGPVNFDLVRQ